MVHIMTVVMKHICAPLVFYIQMDGKKRENS